MAATSLLARLGLRIATLGSAASLAYAAPIAEGDLSQTAHTYASRTGWYHPTPTSFAFVCNGAESLRLIDKGRIGIGGIVPLSAIDIQVNDTSVAGFVRVTSYGAPPYTGPTFPGSGGFLGFQGRRARGTAAAPTALVYQDVLASFSGVGFDGTGWPTTASVTVQMVADEAWTPTARGTRMSLWTTKNGTTSHIEKVRIYGDGGIRFSPAVLFGSTSPGEGVYEFNGKITVLPGLLATPALSFIGDTNTGLYQPEANSLGVVVDGVDAIRVWPDGGMQVGGPFVSSPGPMNLEAQRLLVGAGSIYDPPISFRDYPHTGIYAGVDGLSLVNNYAHVVLVNSTHVFHYRKVYAAQSMDVWFGIQTNSPTALFVRGSHDDYPIYNHRTIDCYTEIGALLTHGNIISGLRTNLQLTTRLVTARTISHYAGWREETQLDGALGVGGSLVFTNLYGGHILNATAPASGVSVVNHYGLYIEGPTRGTTINRSIHVEAGDCYFGAEVAYKVQRGFVSAFTVSENIVNDTTFFNGVSPGEFLLLPPSAGIATGREHTVRNTSATNSCSVQGAGADTIDGGTVPLSPGDAVRVKWDGAMWRILDHSNATMGRVSTVTLTGSGTAAKRTKFTGSAPATITVADGPTGVDYFIRNAGTAVADVTPAGGKTIEGAASFAINPGESIIITLVGTDWTVF